MDRVFLDANCLFLASYRQGATLARLWKWTNIRLLTSAYTLYEAWRNTAHSEQRLRLAELVRAMELVEELAEDESAARGVGLPGKDVPILHAAISGRATHLITADGQHFGPLRGMAIAGVLIQFPADYLSRKKGS